MNKYYSFTLLVIIVLVFSSYSTDGTKVNESYITFDYLKDSSIDLTSYEKDSSYTTNNNGLYHSTITIDSSKYYLVENDLLMNEKEYLLFRRMKILSPKSSDDAKLVGEIRDNKIVQWPQNTILKYCVVESSFANKDQYKLVCEHVQKAVAEWEQLCNVRFMYDKSRDKETLRFPSGDLTFVVLGEVLQESFIATAFFPYAPIKDRRILIGNNYFTTKYDKTGVFRHELGHVLGFRHEHIRSEAPKGCDKNENVVSIDITDYDPKSVMHYFCDGMGTIKLEFTDTDRLGAQAIYGSPRVHN